MTLTTPLNIVSVKTGERVVIQGCHSILEKSMDEFSPQQREREKLRPQKASHLTQRLPIKKNYKNMERTLHFPLFQGLVPFGSPVQTQQKKLL